MGLFDNKLACTDVCLPSIGRFLPRKFASTSRFVVSSRVWSNMIPTRDCDILMTFPTKTDDGTLMWLLARLRNRSPQLTVHVRHHSNTGVYGFYFTAEYESLLKGAEELAISKPVKKEYGGGSREYVHEDQECFQGVEDTTQFLTSQERQSIVYHLLTNLRAVYGDQLGKIRFIEGQSIVPLLISKGIVKQVLPLHCHDDLSQLKTSWVQAFFSSQPLEHICGYFGVQIAMYFAYLGHYTKALFLPAIIGVLLWLLSGTSQTMDDICFVVFAFFNVLWATLYLEHWKRKSSELAYQWGTLDKEDELLVEPRPLYKGHLITSHLTGKLVRHFPSWKRYIFIYCISVPIMVVSLAVVVLVNLAIFLLQDWVNKKIEQQEFSFYVKYVPKVLLAICIGVLDEIYKRIARWLNDQENYRLEETYENNLIIKLILFQFVNSFLSLFYIGFYLQDMNRLQEQLAALLITRQVIGNIKEALLPYILEKAKLLKIGYDLTANMSPASIERQATLIRQCSQESTGSEGSKCEQYDIHQEIRHAGDGYPDGDSSAADEDASMSVHYSGPMLTQAEVEASMSKYEDTFEDYLEMFIQFGYVTLFSSAFPMAALCALLNNIIEIRSDAFKLCVTFQRPFGKRVENIGAWQDALELMSVIAVIVNCALIGLSGLANRLFPDWGTTERIIIIVVLEHIILVFRILLAYIIPDIPNWVAEEKARLEYLRREALKKLEGHVNGHSKTKDPTITLNKATPYRPTPLKRTGSASGLRRRLYHLNKATQQSTPQNKQTHSDSEQAPVQRQSRSAVRSPLNELSLYIARRNQRSRTISPESKRNEEDPKQKTRAKTPEARNRNKPVKNTFDLQKQYPLRGTRSTEIINPSKTARKASTPALFHDSGCGVAAASTLTVGNNQVVYRRISNGQTPAGFIGESGKLADAYHSQQFLEDIGAVSSSAKQSTV